MPISRNRLVGLGSMMALATLLAMAWLSYADHAAVGSPWPMPCIVVDDPHLRQKQMDEALHGPNFHAFPGPIKVPPPTVTGKDITIMKALNSTMKISYSETALLNVLQYLEKTTKEDLCFMFDDVTFKAAQLDPKNVMEDRITKDYKKLRIRTFLHMILREKDWDYYIEDGLIVITTKARADSKMVIKSYPIHNLIVAPPGVNLLMLPEQTQLALKAAADGLITQVTGALEPEYWKANGGVGDMGFDASGSKLLVKASLEMHCLLIASELLDNKPTPVEEGVLQKIKNEVVVKTYDITGLIDPRNSERSKAELQSALNLALGKGEADKLKDSMVFLTHPEVLVVRQPLEVHMQIGRLVAALRIARPGLKAADGKCNPLLGGPMFGNNAGGNGVFGIHGGGVFGNTGAGSGVFGNNGGEKKP